MEAVPVGVGTVGDQSALMLECIRCMPFEERDYASNMNFLWINLGGRDPCRGCI